MSGDDAPSLDSVDPLETRSLRGRDGPNLPLRTFSGQPALGASLQLASPNATRLLAAQGCFDWLVVDMEHSPIDVPTATVMLSTIADVSGGRITPLVRLLSGTQENIKRALDAGAQGVIAPLVGTAEDR